MTVKVVFFAAAREITGRDQMDLELDDTPSVADIRRILATQFPDLLPLMEKSTWSVNHEYVTNDHALCDGAEIGLIPPVSGG